MLRRLTLRPLASPSLAHLSRLCPGSVAPAVPHGDTPTPPFSPPYFHRSFLDIHKLGSKEAIEKEKERLKDELNRGYFADFKELDAHGGKVAMANKTVIPSVAALNFPELEANFSDGRSIKLPFDSNCGNSANSSLALVCVLFRANSQAMIESWTVPFSTAFSACSNVQIYEVSFIDSWILSLGPVKHLMLRVMRKPKNPLRQVVYSFGDHYYFRKKLHIVNLLTGYAFLLDGFGRIRWQGFGFATEEELASLISCTELLLNEK